MLGDRGSVFALQVLHLSAKECQILLQAINQIMTHSLGFLSFHHSIPDRATEEINHYCFPVQQQLIHRHMQNLYH